MRAIARGAALLVLGCGARTGLLSGEPDAGAIVDAGPPDTSEDAPVDAPDDVVDAPEDVPIVTCEDAGTTFVFVITSDTLLYRFDPPSSSFALVGTTSCPSTTPPFSMAVRRNGTAYVLDRDGHLFEVDTLTAACKPTTFVPGQLGWLKFGMAFVADPLTGGEKLFVSESSYQHPSLGLGRIDLGNMKLDFVGPFSSDLGNAVELTGTGEGRLYAFGLLATDGSTLADVNPTNAAVMNQKLLTIGVANSSFAFAHWGGDFYFFVAPGPSLPTTAYRYQPVSGALDAVATLPTDVVGAGVSTCAPH